jgi:hypothetical protein
LNRSRVTVVYAGVARAQIGLVGVYGVGERDHGDGLGFLRLAPAEPQRGVARLGKRHDRLAIGGLGIVCRRDALNGVAALPVRDADGP